MAFHLSLSDSKSSQVSKTRLRILAVLSNAVVWIVSTSSPTSKSSRPLNNPLVIVPNAPITIGTIVTFQFSSKVEVLILLFAFLQNYSVVHRDSKVDSFSNSLFFLLIIIRSGILAGISWSVCILKSHTPFEFFTSVLADGFSLEFEWQQVSSSLQDSSQYFGCSQ